MPFVILDGARCRQLRLGKAFSQVELTNRSGLDRRTISRMEASRPVSLATARRLFRALGIRQPDRLILRVVDGDVRSR